MFGGFVTDTGFLMWVNHTGFLPSLDLGINFKIFAYGLLITVVFGIISGVAPAWRNGET